MAITKSMALTTRTLMMLNNNRTRVRDAVAIMHSIIKHLIQSLINVQREARLASSMTKLKQMPLLR